MRGRSGVGRRGVFLLSGTVYSAKCQSFGTRRFYSQVSVVIYLLGQVLHLPPPPFQQQGNKAFGEEYDFARRSRAKRHHSQDPRPDGAASRTFGLARALSHLQDVSPSGPRGQARGTPANSKVSWSLGVSPQETFHCNTNLHKTSATVFFKFVQLHV